MNAGVAASSARATRPQKWATRLALALPMLVVFVSALLLYVRTAAPSVMGGDSAEFQMSAPLLGVPHPTTYPLYTLIGKVFTLALPWGDLAHRVTLVSACSAALAAAILVPFVARVSGSRVAGVVAAVALAVTPGLWNVATMAEVYGLLMALLAAFWLTLVQSNTSTRALFVAAFVAGLGVSHHVLFGFTGFPLFVVVALRACVQAPSFALRVRRCAMLALAFGLGLTPWLFPLIQYARYGPLSGEDYGFPRHYYWGAPASWQDAARMLVGGPVSAGVLQVPTLPTLVAALRLVVERLWFEFGPLGVVLGMLGSVALLRQRAVWLSSVWLCCGTLIYMLLLGPAVQDAPIFTIPMLLPWALWVGLGAFACGRFGAWLWQRHAPVLRLAAFVLVLAATLAWGYTRLPYANKRHLTVWRNFGEATLAQLPPNAVVIAHWEQGMVLQYLIHAEEQRRDVWVDVVEPTDDPWLPRATRRYPDRVVFFVGSAADVDTMPVELIQADAYANLYRLNARLALP